MCVHYQSPKSRGPRGASVSRVMSAHYEYILDSLATFGNPEIPDSTAVPVSVSARPVGAPTGARPSPVQRGGVHGPCDSLARPRRKCTSRRSVLVCQRRQQRLAVIDLPRWKPRRCEQRTGRTRMPPACSQLDSILFWHCDAECMASSRIPSIT